MSISPISDVNSVYGPRGTQSNAPANQPQKNARPVTRDTVELSSAAKAYLQKAGVDSDGDQD